MSATSAKKKETNHLMRGDLHENYKRTDKSAEASYHSQRQTETIPPPATYEPDGNENNQHNKKRKITQNRNQQQHRENADQKRNPQLLAENTRGMG